MFEKPRWMRDLIRFAPLKSQFVLTGNVRDYQVRGINETSCEWNSLVDFTASELWTLGFESVLVLDPVNGFRFPATLGIDDETKLKIASKFNFTVDSSKSPNLADMARTIEQIALSPDSAVAVIVDFSSQLIIRPDGLSKIEHDAFTRTLVASQHACAKPVGNPPKSLFNTVIWIAEKEGDLPDWLVIGNPRVRSIPIGKPDHIVRRVFSRSLLNMLDDYATGNAQEQSKVLTSLVEQTEGFLLLDLVSIIELARAEGIKSADIDDAVRRYKVGVSEDPWKKIDREKIRGGNTHISNRVKGQTHAVTHVLDIVKRAITGVGSDGRGRRPRGVVFLAGPTGVGKTELAKTVTDLLFGDENAYIRFDMSEFSSEHSDQRLIGAPPGYVGYDVGGELTNAIREKPFSVVLFDEIEKAHPRILDKFLQILDDGVLTSGRGEKVYFSEALIIFTSNLGIYKQDEFGRRSLNVSMENSYEELESSVRDEIDSYFKLTLNRPEILNRIGENIVVFDFIREDVARQIYRSMMISIHQAMTKKQSITVNMSDEVSAYLERECLSDLSNGGRGIRNIIEAYYVNPLSRALFDESANSGDKFLVESIDISDGMASLTIARV